MGLGFYKRVHLLKKHLDIRERHTKLLAVEGWYDAPVVIPVKYRALHETYKTSGSKLKFTRWLMRNADVTDRELSDLGEYLNTNPVRFKLSCRHNDLLRLAETNHYSSCLMLGSCNSKYKQQYRYLADPDIAVLYVPDASGKFKWRAMVRLVVHPSGTGFAFLVYKKYGNGPTPLIMEKLAELLPVFYATKTDVGCIRLYSPTVHNNSIVGSIVWSDHPIVFENNRLVMWGTQVQPEW